MQVIKFSVIAITMLVLGCTSTYGSKIEPEDIDKIEKGVTTETQVREWFGKPTLTQTDTEGYKMIQYAYGEATNNQAAYIPVVGAFFSKSDAAYSTLAIEIDGNGLVKNYTIMEGENEGKSIAESATD
jgi:outer membrane protein assembly factor BamE (lipoprotein component of BamABCDE complex)